MAAIAIAMEAKLRRHDAAWGQAGWRDDTAARMHLLLEDHVAELLCTTAPDQVLAKAADVANYAMFLADLAGGIAAATPPEA